MPAPRVAPRRRRTTNGKEHDRMEGRTTATQGGGDLVIGGGPPIDGVLHAWHYADGAGAGKPPFGFMLGHTQAEDLQDALGNRREEVVRSFTGAVRVSFGGEQMRAWVRSRSVELAYLSFYAPGESAPQRVVRLYDGAIDAAIDAIGEALNPIVPMPVGLHDASLTAPAREQLEQL